MNFFCEEFIKKVVACEDISSETSNGLVNICETIIERLPAVFTVIFQLECHIKLPIHFFGSLLMCSICSLLLGSIDGIGAHEKLGKTPTNQNNIECIVERYR